MLPDEADRREARAAYMKQWRAANAGRIATYNSENRERDRMKLRRWRAANPEKVAESARRQRERHKERNRLYRQRKQADADYRERKRLCLASWRERNPEKAARGWAKSIIAEQTGLSASEFPAQLVEAKSLHLLVRRAVK